MRMFQRDPAIWVLMEDGSMRMYTESVSVSQVLQEYPSSRLVCDTSPSHPLPPSKTLSFGRTYQLLPLSALHSSAPGAPESKKQQQQKHERESEDPVKGLLIRSRSGVPKDDSGHTGGGRGPTRQSTMRVSRSSQDLRALGSAFGSRLTRLWGEASERGSERASERCPSSPGPIESLPIGPLVDPSSLFQCTGGQFRGIQDDDDDDDDQVEELDLRTREQVEEQELELEVQKALWRLRRPITQTSDEPQTDNWLADLQRAQQRDLQGGLRKAQGQGIPKVQSHTQYGDLQRQHSGLAGRESLMLPRQQQQQQQRAHRYSIQHAGEWVHQTPAQVHVLSATRPTRVNNCPLPPAASSRPQRLPRTATITTGSHTPATISRSSSSSTSSGNRRRSLSLSPPAAASRAYPFLSSKPHTLSTPSNRPCLEASEEHGLCISEDRMSSSYGNSSLYVHGAPSLLASGSNICQSSGASGVTRNVQDSGLAYNSSLYGQRSRVVL